MTGRHLLTLRILLVFGDFLAAAGVFLVVSAVRLDLPDAQWSVGIDVGTAAVLFAATWVGVFLLMGLYRLRLRWGFLADARDVLRGTVVVLALTLSMLFLLRQGDVSRLFLAMLFVVQPTVAVGLRFFLRRWFEWRRRMGRDLSYMLVVGTGPEAQDFAREVEGHRALGIRVVGHLVVPGDEPSNELVTRPVLGVLDDINRVFRSTVVDEVAVCLPAHATHQLEAIVAMAADEGKTVRVPRALEEGVLVGAAREEFSSFLVHSIVHDAQRDLEHALKRGLDVAGAVMGLIVLSPIFLASALAVWMGDGGPILFRQTRVGRHGRPFTLLKFRTMHSGAEDRQDELTAMNDMRGPAFKMHADPRVTRVGRFLRRSSIDELPQLWNVLLGEMSLVGPRPAPPREVDAYDIWHRRRLSVRPGMTGLWQVEGRGQPDFDDRAELDLRYIDQWSLWMDLQILLRTLPAVLLRPGQ